MNPTKFIAVLIVAATITAAAAPKGWRKNKSAAFGEMIAVAVGHFIAVFL
jgi:hypothetical protein